MAHGAAECVSPSKEVRLAAEEGGKWDRYSPFGDPGKNEDLPSDGEGEFKVMVREYGRPKKGSRAPTRWSKRKRPGEQ